MVLISSVALHHVEEEMARTACLLKSRPSSIDFFVLLPLLTNHLNLIVTTPFDNEKRDIPCLELPHQHRQARARPSPAQAPSPPSSFGLSAATSMRQRR